MSISNIIIKIKREKERERERERQRETKRDKERQRKKIFSIAYFIINLISFKQLSLKETR